MAQINRFSRAPYANGNVLEMPLKCTIPLNYTHLLMPIRKTRGGYKSHHIKKRTVLQSVGLVGFFFFFLYLLHIVMPFNYFYYINVILRYVQVHFVLNQYRLFYYFILFIGCSFESLQRC